MTRMKYIIVYYVLFSVMIYSQGLTISENATFSLGSATLSISNDFVNNGTFNPQNGTIAFTGPSGNQTYTESTSAEINNFIVNKASGDVILSNDITLKGTLTCTSGDLDLNGKTLTLGTSALLTETDGNTVTGTSGIITTVRSLSALNNSNVAGMGAVITTSAIMGTTAITRGHAEQNYNGNKSILRYFEITPQNNSRLGAKLVIKYDDSELNGLNEAELKAYKFDDSGSNWYYQGSNLDAAQNKISIENIYGFSKWTAAADFNSPPLINIETEALTFVEGGQSIPVSSNITVKDAEDINMHGATVAIARNFTPGEDLLSYSGSGALTAIWDESSGILRLSGAGSKLTYQKELRLVKYQNTNTEDPGTEIRRVDFSVKCGEVSSNTVSRNIIINPVNDPPVLANIEETTLSYTEGDPETRVTGTIEVTDVDNSTIQSATVAITNNYISGEDMLSFDNTGAISGVFNTEEGSLSLTGTDSKDNYQTALRNVAYFNAGEDNPTQSTRTISFIVNDGSENSNSQGKNISVIAVSDPPLIDTAGVDTALQVTGEDSLRIVLNINDGGGYPEFVVESSSDSIYAEVVFNGSATLLIIPLYDTDITATITLIVTEGNRVDTLTFFVEVFETNYPPAILTVNDYVIQEGQQFDIIVLDSLVNDPNDDKDELTWSCSGGVNCSFEINDARELIVGIGNPDWNGMETIILKVTDKGELFDSVNVLFLVTAVNDAPVILPIPAIIFPEDSSCAVALTPYASDVDNNIEDISWALLDCHDSLDASINEETKVLSISSRANFFGSNIPIVLEASDSELTSNPDTIMVSITPVNDPPFIDDLPALSFNEDDSLIVPFNIWQPYISDPDTPNDELFYSLIKGEYVSFEPPEPIKELILFAGTNWFGTDSLILSVNDEYYSISKKVIINVLSVNDLPQFIDLPDTIWGTGDTTVFNLWEHTDDIETPDVSLVFGFTDYDENILGLNFNSDAGNLSLFVIPGFNDPIGFTLIAIDEEGDSANAFLTFKPAITTGLGELALQVPDKYLLEQNYPNPFNPSTTIRFGLPFESNVKIMIYNMIGECVGVLAGEVMSAGYYEYQWNASGLASGVYICSVYAEATDRSARFSKVKKMVLLR